MKNSYKKNSSFFRFLYSFLLLSCTTLLIAQPDTVTFNGSNNAGMIVTTSHSEGGIEGDQTVDDLGFLPNLSAASRFLSQASFGADYETIEAVSNMSYNDWLDAQFDTTSAFSIQQFTLDLTILALDSTLAMGGDPNDVEPELLYWQTAWWQYTMVSPDVLRQRVALALSEIFVISEIPQLEDVPLALANYYDMLLGNSFGNFRDLLDDVTFHPAMGVYLTHINNPKSDTTLNRFPDENYAREVMQLFTIGLYELNNDGSRKVDAFGAFIPTYTNTDIQELAKIFTGFTFGDALVFGQDPIGEPSFLQDMKMNNTWHEPGPKDLLGGFAVPDRNPVDGLADVKDALDNLFAHPNVGPFLAYRLIQRLITSNPSADYIDRVASVFNDNGSGVRGDLKAVVRAILMDDEARDCAFINDPLRGMLREPIVRYAHICRAFNAFSIEGLYRNRMEDFHELTFQKVLASPSVFNFFTPDYVPLGPVQANNLVGPEFQITNSVTIMGYANELNDWILKENQVMEHGDLWSGEPNTNDKYVNFDFTDELALETLDELDDLIERLNLILLHGNLSDTTRQLLYNGLSQIPEDDWEDRVRMAIFLVMISPDYLIFK